jgi:SOS-response transcriptional repressor LexA
MNQEATNQKARNDLLFTNLAVEICDEMLSPIALPGDLALIQRAERALPGDLVAVESAEGLIVRHLLHHDLDNQSITLANPSGEQTHTQFRLLGIVREIRRAIVNGQPRPCAEWEAYQAH